MKYLAANRLLTVLALIGTLAFAQPASAAKADYVRQAQWHLGFLNVPLAHEISVGSGVTVAVVDTGVFKHADLRRNLIPGADIVGSTDGDGQIDDDGHGTRMAGLIAGHGRNGDGILGIAPAARILPIREQTADDKNGPDSITRAVEIARERSSDVINISLTTSPSARLDAAVKAALSEDIVVVAGAGNNSKSGVVKSPADIAGVLAVGAVGKDGKHADLSVVGSEVQICAPGVDVATTNTGGKYATSSGTSASTAIVSGAVALVRANFPDLSGPEVVHRLTATADDIGPPGRDDECGFGVLNIVEALTADVPPLAASPGASTSTAPPVATAPTGTARPEPKPNSSNIPLIAGGVGVLVLGGGLVGLLVARRKRSS